MQNLRRDLCPAQVYCLRLGVLKNRYELLAIANATSTASLAFVCHMIFFFILILNTKYLTCKIYSVYRADL